MIAQARREQAEFARERSLSERRTCALLSVAHSTLGYQPRWAGKDAPPLGALSEVRLSPDPSDYRARRACDER